MSTLERRIEALEQSRQAAGPALVVLVQDLSHDWQRPVRVTAGGREWLCAAKESEDAFHTRIIRDLGTPDRTLHVFINKFS